MLFSVAQSRTDLALVRAEVVEHEVEADLRRVERADVAAELEELAPALALFDVAVEAIAGDVVGGEQVAHAVRAQVGSADAPRLRPGSPGLAARLGLEVERAEQPP